MSAKAIKAIHPTGPADKKSAGRFSQFDGNLIDFWYSLFGNPLVDVPLIESHASALSMIYLEVWNLFVAYKFIDSACTDFQIPGQSLFVENNILCLMLSIA
jgi:hypothetical protein